MPNFYDALAGGYAPIPAPGFDPLQTGQGISPFLMAQQQPVGTQLQDIFMKALEAIVPQSNTAEGMPTAPPLPGPGGQFGPNPLGGPPGGVTIPISAGTTMAPNTHNPPMPPPIGPASPGPLPGPGGQFGPPQLAGAGMMVPGMPPPVAPGGSGGASAMMPPLPPAQNVGPPPTPMGLRGGMSAPPPRSAAPGAPAAGAPSEQSTWEQILSNPDLLEFGLRLMASSQPHGPGIVGPTFAGAVGEAGIGQLQSSRVRDIQKEQQALQERQVAAQETSAEAARKRALSPLAQAREEFQSGAYGDPKSPETRALFEEIKKSISAGEDKPTELMRDARFAFPDDPVKQRAFVRAARERKPSEGDQVRSALRNEGYSDQQIGDFLINKDRFQFRTDMFGTPFVYDRYAGEMVTNEGPAGGQPPSTEAPPAPSAALPSPEAGYEQGTGASGFFGKIANTITDAMGLGLQAPETEKANQAITTLQNRTELFLTASVPGRESNQVRQRLRELTVTPGSLFQADDRAFLRLTQTRDFISDEANRLQGVLDNPAGFKADDLAAARENLGQLRGLQGAYDQIIENFRSKSGGSSEQQGEIKQIRSADEYNALPPGATYIDPAGIMRRKQ